MLEIRMLGTFDVRLAGNPVEIPSRPAQSLMAYLVLNVGTRFRREKLAGMLWPDSDETNARSNLRHALWRLRKALGEDAFLADKVTIGFNPEIDFKVDVFKLDKGTAEAESSEVLMGSVSEYGGELLPGFYESWVVLERERLRAVLDQKFQLLLESLIGRERWGDVLEWGERWIALGYVPEPAYRALMIACCGLGDSAGMAVIYRRCMEALKSELGVKPSEQTQQLYDQLSKGEMPVKTYRVTTPLAEGDTSAAIRTLLQGWREKGVETLDLASLAIVHAARGDVTFEPEDLELLIHSALHHEVDVEPWLKRSRTPDNAVAALEKALSRHPKPRIRMRIVEALGGFESKRATDVLIRMIASDHSPTICSEAALIVARQGRLQDVLTSLAQSDQARDDSVAIAALVAISDEIGIPDGVHEFPKLPIAFGLARRRWREWKTTLRRQSVRLALGSATAMVVVTLSSILQESLFNTDQFTQILETVALPFWVFTNVLLGMVWGACLGGITGFLVGAADALLSSSAASIIRIVSGSIAGLVHSFFIIFTAAVGDVWTNQGPQVYIPVYIINGLITGAALSLVIPNLTSSSGHGRQHGKLILAIILLACSGAASMYFAYGGEIRDRLFLFDIQMFLLTAVVLPLGFALANRKGSEESTRMS